MPVYEYLCKTCSSMEIESRNADNRDDEKLCKTCNLPMKRLYSSIRTAFKGSGFYSTDK